jgi:subtilisin family serine protease
VRIRPLIAGAAVVAAAVGVAPADAEYPDVCFVAVAGAQARRAVVSSDPAADGRVVDVVRRMGGRVGPRYAPLGLRHVELPTPALRERLVTDLARVPGVRAVDRDFEVRVHRAPNDPFTRFQWAIGRTGLDRAWDRQTGKASVVVAVLDTGVAANHPDLRSKLVPGIDVVNGDSDASDDEGHGTHVAGTVAAATNNRAGVAGVAWGSRVMPVKVLDENGSGGSCDIAVGMVEAVRGGASILNLSLGGASRCPVVWQAAVAYATQEDVLVVASSGNDALQGAPESAPANCPDVLGVGATTDRDQPAVFSSFGPTVDVSAPGQDILSTTIDPKTGRLAYGMSSGTSMAAPHVAGLAALVRSQFPALTPAQVADRIVRTSRDLGPRGRDDFFGVGRIDAAKALAP